MDPLLTALLSIHAQATRYTHTTLQALTEQTGLELYAEAGNFATK